MDFQPGQTFTIGIVGTEAFADGANGIYATNGGGSPTLVSGGSSGWAVSFDVPSETFTITVSPTVARNNSSYFGNYVVDDGGSFTTYRGLSFGIAPYPASSSSGSSQSSSTSGSSSTSSGSSTSSSSSGSSSGGGGYGALTPPALPYAPPAGCCCADPWDRQAFLLSLVTPWAGQPAVVTPWAGPPCPCASSTSAMSSLMSSSSSSH